MPDNLKKRVLETSVDDWFGSNGHKSEDYISQEFKFRYYRNTVKPITYQFPGNHLLKSEDKQGLLDCVERNIPENSILLAYQKDISITSKEICCHAEGILLIPKTIISKKEKVLY